MLVVGLTGGIGSGKSTVSNCLRDKGYKVIDADQIGRDIMKPGMPALSMVAKTFGSDIIDEDGCLKRKELAKRAFSSPENKKKLDEITHKEIMNTLYGQMEMCMEAGEEFCFLDVPLLFEVELDKKCDVVWVVTAEMEQRIARVIARDSTTREDVVSRIRCQMSDDEKIARASDVLDNSFTVEKLYEDIERLLEKYEKRNNL